MFDNVLGAAFIPIKILCSSVLEVENSLILSVSCNLSSHGTGIIAAAYILRFAAAILIAIAFFLFMSIFDELCFFIYVN